jgi:hypothetical protein
MIAGMMRAMRRLALVGVVVVVVTRGMVAQAGPAYSLARKALCADAAVEVEVNLAKARERGSSSWLRNRAMARARVTATFYGKPAADLPRPLDFYLQERIWREGEKRGRLRVIVFAGRPKGTPSLLYGVEGEPTDVDPDYATVRAAVVQYARWRERREDPAVFTEVEKTLATTTSDPVAELAWQFLCSSGHGDATARAAHLAAPSSPVTTMIKENYFCQTDLACHAW